MTSSTAMAPLLQTVDRLLRLEGFDPEAVDEDDKVAIATQIVCVACENSVVEDRAHVLFKEIR